MSNEHKKPDSKTTENAKCPEWHKFLESIWPGNTALKNQLQEFMGYCLTADNSLQKFAIFIGKSRGGKGVITDIMREMVGKFTVNYKS